MAEDIETVLVDLFFRDFTDISRCLAAPLSCNSFSSPLCPKMYVTVIVGVSVLIDTAHCRVKMWYAAPGFLM